MTIVNIDSYRTDNQFTRRYLSVVTRQAVFSGQVNTASFDSGTGGIYRFTYTGSVGNVADTRTHMMMDIGTSAGARNLGTFRIRKPADGTYVYVEEVSRQESGIVNGAHFTIRRDFRPVSVKPRVVLTQTGVSYINGFVAYHDYDLVYSVQNSSIKPKANITQSGAYTDGTLIQAKPAGFVDEGQVFRTVVLSSSNSIAIAPSTSIASRVWDVRDGTITVGTATSTDITATFPVGFRWISVTVTASNGIADIMYLPIWTHDTSNMPIVSFKRESDTSEEWRDMSFSFYGDNNEFPESVLPEGSMLCYWEYADFGGGSTPAEYIGQALVFVRQETESLKLYEPEIKLDASGIGYWLSQARSYGSKISAKITPLTWYEIVSLNAQRAVHYCLREYSTALIISNFFPKMTTNGIESENLPDNNVWEQIKFLAQGDEFREVKCDSLGGIWITKPTDLMNSTERANWIVTCSVNAQDILGESPISYPNEFVQKVSITKGSGFSFDGTTDTIYLSQAPGKTEGYAPSKEEAPVLRLNTSNPQAQLNQMIGDYWTRNNNPQPQIELPMFYNVNFVEPAYGEVIIVSFAVDSLKGTTLISVPCRLIRVSRASNDEIGINQISWSVMPITDGVDGDYVEWSAPVEYNEDGWESPVENIFPDSYIPPPFMSEVSPFFPPPPTPPTPFNPDPLFNVAFVTFDNKLFKTANFTNESPTWASATLTLDGNIVQALVDPHCPFYVNGTGSMDIIVVTTEKIYTVQNIFNTVVVTARFTFSAVSPLRSLSISSGFEKNATVVSGYHNTTQVTTSSNLTSWSAELQIGTTGTDICNKYTTTVNNVWASMTGITGVNSGLTVTAGATIAVFAPGTWIRRAAPTNWTYTADGDGIAALSPFRAVGVSRYSLVGRIGSTWFLLGQSANIVAPATGTIFMMMNEDPIHAADNIGFLTVSLSAIQPCAVGDIPLDESSPGAYNSSKSAGRIYTTAGVAGLGYLSDDNGGSFSLAQSAVPTRNIDADGQLAGEIGIPQKGNTSNEIVGFYGAKAGNNRKLYRFSGVNRVDISPVSSAVTYGPYKTGNTLSIHPKHVGNIICCGINRLRTLVGVWESSNNGGDWLTVQAPISDAGGTGRYERAVYGSASAQIMYLWGTKGKLGVGVKGTTWTISSKVGNINQATTGEIINIFVAGGIS